MHLFRSFVQREKDNKKRREKYAFQSVIHGISLMLSHKVKERPSNRRIKIFLQRMLFLTEEMKKNLQNNSEERQQQLSNLLHFQSRNGKKFIGRNIKQDEKILIELKKYMAQNDDDQDLKNGFHLLCFVADQCVRSNRPVETLKGFVRLYDKYLVIEFIF